jgi:hypothetical protein
VFDNVHFIAALVSRVAALTTRMTRSEFLLSQSDGDRSRKRQGVVTSLKHIDLDKQHKFRYGCKKLPADHKAILLHFTAQNIKNSYPVFLHNN